MTDVVVGVVHDEKVDAEWVMCLLRLRPYVQEVVMVPGGPGNFDVARNKVAARFLATGASHLLTVDTDMVFSAGDLDALLRREVPVVSAVYFIADGRPVFSRREGGYLKTVHDWKGTELVDVDACGGGFMLIARDAFESIGEPDSDRAGPWYRQSAVGASGSVLEPDHAFCQRVQQTGNRVYVDPLVVVGHIKPRVLYSAP